MRGNKVGRSRVDCIIREVSERVYLVDVGDAVHIIVKLIVNCALDVLMQS